MIKNFIFDIDGTLFNTRELTIESISHALQRIGHPSLTKDDWTYFYKFGIKALIKHRHIPSYKIWLAVYFFQNYKRKHLHNLQLFPSIDNTLETLHQRKKILGIISSNSQKIINQILINTQIDLFTFVHPAGFLGKVPALKKVLKKYHLNPMETVYVGDEIHDVIAAKSLDIHSAAVTWGFNSPEALASHHPDFLLNSPEEILKIQ